MEVDGFTAAGNAKLTGRNMGVNIMATYHHAFGLNAPLQVNDTMAAHQKCSKE